MKKLIKNIFLMLFGIMLQQDIFSQSLSATIDKNPVGAGDQFQITFSLNGTGSNFQGPSFPDFNVLGGPSVSNSMNIINGSVSQSMSFTYFLQAKSEGTFKIGSASVIANGKKLESPPFTVTVVKGNPKPQGNNQQQSDNGSVNSNDVFIRASVDKTNVFRGEAIVVTYKIYTRVQLVNSYAITKAPALNGFWSQDIMKPQQLEINSNETINGVRYGVGQLKKAVLFPQQNGNLTIDPMEAEFIVRVQAKRNQSNNPFDIFNDPFLNDPFFGRGVRDVKVGLKSEPIKITVKELPLNTPVSFSGSVGKFSFEASLDKNNTRSNDPVTLKVKISGKGNLSLVDPPKINFPPDIETYDPKVTDNFTTTAAGSSGNKIFEYLLIPRHEGNYKIDPVEFSYFDLEKKNYITLTSTAFNLKVEQGIGERSVATIGTNKADVQMLGKDIRFIKTGAIDFVNSSQMFFGSSLFFLLLLLPVILLILLIILKRKKDERASNLTFVKRSKANKMAKKRLVAANKMLKEKNNEKFYDEIFKALWGYVSDKLGIPPADLSKDTAASALRQKNVSEESIFKLISTLDYSEFARFASGTERVSAVSVYSDAVNIITKLEEEIK